MSGIVVKALLCIGGGLLFGSAECLSYIGLKRFVEKNNTPNKSNVNKDDCINPEMKTQEA